MSAEFPVAWLFGNYLMLQSLKNLKKLLRKFKDHEKMVKALKFLPAILISSSITKDSLTLFTSLWLLVLLCLKSYVLWWTNPTLIVLYIYCWYFTMNFSYWKSLPIEILLCYTLHTCKDFSFWDSCLINKIVRF